MNDMTDKPQTNGTGDSKGGCNCDYALAFLLLRGWLAIRAIVTGPAMDNTAPAATLTGEA